MPVPEGRVLSFSLTGETNLPDGTTCTVIGVVTIGATQEVEESGGDASSRDNDDSETDELQPNPRQTQRPAERPRPKETHEVRSAASS